MPRNPLMRASSYSPVRNAGSRADGCYSDGEGGAPFRYYETTGHLWGHGRETAGVGDGSLSNQILQNSQKMEPAVQSHIFINVEPALQTSDSLKKNSRLSHKRKKTLAGGSQPAISNCLVLRHAVVKVLGGRGEPCSGFHYCFSRQNQPRNN